MTNRQILEKAIQKAIDGGWDISDGRYVGPMSADSVMDWFEEDYYHFIFNHDFAKALWGDKEYTEQNEWDLYRMKKWEAHLMLMVIADDPIKYLGEHLDA